MKLGALTFQCACLAWCMRSILSASRAFRMTMTSARVMAGRSFFVVYIALSLFEVMRAWSLSGAQECSRVRDISFCRGDIATRVPRVKTVHAPTTTLCFCMGTYRKAPQGNTSRSVRFSDTRAGDRLKSGRWAKWGGERAIAHPSRAPWRLRSGACAQTRGRAPPLCGGRMVEGAVPLRGHQDRPGLWAAQLDGPEDVVKLEFLDFEVQRALGNVEVVCDLGEIAVGAQDRRDDGLALHRFEARDGGGSRRAVWRLPRGNRRGEL